MCKKEFENYGQKCSLCKNCKKIYDREYHTNRNKEQLKRKLFLQKQRVLENRKKLYQYFLEHPCIICGENRVPCLQFHHLDMDNKEFTISNSLNKSWKNIKKEIDKCIVLCANCHSVQTAKDSNWYNF